ncbi:MAG: hypothetical protein LBJ00_15135 [Planctomycetaceae bacterium]|nr:hypothetical protein [Planctomycetaceae bacterium]
MANSIFKNFLEHIIDADVCRVCSVSEISFILLLIQSGYLRAKPTANASFGVLSCGVTRG